MRRATPYLLLLAAIGAGLLAYAMDSPAQSPEQQKCCRDVGLLQEALVTAMNESSAGRSESARDIGWRALHTTGLKCQWLNQEGDVLLKGGGSARLVCR